MAEAARSGLREMKALPKAFPSEGKVAEAARSGAKTDEVECPAGNEIRLTPGEILFSKDEIRFAGEIGKAGCG